MPTQLAAACACLAVLVVGCVPPLPANAGAEPPERSLSGQAGTARLWAEPELADAVWIEIPRNDGDGTVGGYLSLNDSDQTGLIIMLRGASTYQEEGAVVETRRFHEIKGRPYRDAGYRTLTVHFPECGTAYGREDLDHLLQAIDWLEAGGGAEALGVEHTYLFGYSVGATAAMLANRQREVAAVAAVGGVTEPQQFERSWQVYRLVASLYPDNEGICHLASTLAAYGPPGSPGWNIFDTVGQVTQLKSPMLVIQGTKDQIYSTANSYNLDAAYQQAVASGLALPVIEFLYLEGADHFAPMSDPFVTESVLAFFERHVR